MATKDCLRQTRRVLLLAVGLLVAGWPDSACFRVRTDAAATHVIVQYCNPAVVDYLVRDEKGKLLGEAELKSVAEQLPKTVGDADVDVAQVSFADDGKTIYWFESVDWEKGKKQPSLEFVNAKTCVMHLPEATLSYHGKKMRLLFNIDIARDQKDRRPVIDALPFSEGTFELDLKGWQGDGHQIIPAARWKRTSHP